MTEPCDTTLSTFRYLSGEIENICRLCFGLVDHNGGTALDESRALQTAYFDATVTFHEIFSDIGIVLEDGLPQMLCPSCVDSAINSFLFLKLCQYSHSQWLGSVEQFNKTLDLANTIAPTVKTAYLVTNHDNKSIYTSKKIIKNKEAASKKITNLIRAKKTYYKKATQESSTICDECGAKFTGRKHLVSHIRKMHSKVKHSCKYCSKMFLTATQVHDHLDRVHKPKVLQCPKCDKSFSTHKLLQLHDSNLHQAVICKRCFIQFPSKRVLRQHLDRHDTNKCPRCYKEFNNKYSFKIHLKICGNDMAKQLTFFCDLCNKGYSRKNGLRSHMVTEHKFGRIYPCKWCNKPFDAPSKLQNHIVKHTRERNFHCEQCGSLFVTQAALQYHVRLHTGERPFPCDMCDERFLSASRRAEHKRRKHLTSVKVCPVCFHTFGTTHELKKHLERHQNPKSRLFVAENEVTKSTKEIVIMQSKFILRN